MPQLIFKLNGVSEEEADSVRAILDEHQIEYYETTAGRWGVSMPGIWLPDESQLSEARELLNNYQAERLAKFEIQQKLMLEQGSQPTLKTQFWTRPFRFVLAIVAIVFVLGLSLYPFLDLLGVF